MSHASIAPIMSQLNALAIEADRPSKLVVGDAPAGGSGGMGNFAQTLTRAIGEVNQSQQAAGKAEDDFAMGRGGLPTAMLAVSRAQLELDAAVQVRNRLIQAYNDVMQMGV